jgi:hypothetical protein
MNRDWPRAKNLVVRAFDVELHSITACVRAAAGEGFAQRYSFGPRAVKLDCLDCTLKTIADHPVIFHCSFSIRFDRRGEIESVGTESHFHLVTACE